MAGATDSVRSKVAGSFTGTGQSGSFLAPARRGQPGSGRFNVFIYGTFSATVQLERSFDGGTTWVVCSEDAAGTPASYTGVASLVIEEPEDGMLYRLNCTAWTSGTISYRMSA